VGWQRLLFFADTDDFTPRAEFAVSAQSRSRSPAFKMVKTQVVARVFFAVIAVAAFTSCSQDPEAVRRKYIQAGNKYFQARKYSHAAILYRGAIRRDPKFAEGYYRLALAELQQNRLDEAVRPLRVAIQLLPPGPEVLDAKSKLANIYLAYLAGPVKDEPIWLESKRLASDLVASGLGAYDGHRLMGRMAMVEAVQTTRRGLPDQTKQHLKTSIDEFREANAIRPFEPDVALPLARGLISDNQLREAEQVYLSLLNHSPSYVPVYGDLYNLYIRQRRLADAENILERGLERNPKELAFASNLAWHYHVAGRDGEALRMIEQLKNMGRGTPRIYYIVGSFYLKLGRRDEAIRHYEEGIRTEPKESNYYRKRIAETFITEKKYLEAVKAIESVLKDDPKDAEARVLRGSIYLRTGDLNNAVTDLQTAVRSDLNNPAARYLLGSALAEQGQYAIAIPELEKAMQLDPSHLQARLKLAQLQILIGQDEGAVQTTQNILEELDEHNASAQMLRAIALRKLSRLEDAQADIQSVLKAQPNSPEALLQLGELRLSAGNYKEAEQAFRRSYEQNPRDTRGLLRIAEMYVGKNEAEKAMQILRAESKKQPDNLQLRRSIAGICIMAKDYTSAIDEYQGILTRLDPKTILAYEIQGGLGEAYRASGQYELALSTLTKAREGLPGDPAILNNLAVTLLQLGRNDDAKKLYENTLSAHAENAIALNNFAYLIAEKSGDFDTALSFAQRARQMAPKELAFADTIAYIYLKKNLVDNALEILEDLVVKKPGDATFRMHLGEALLKKGDKARAKQELKIALSSGPSAEDGIKIKDLLTKIGS
jgi:tetratricopeptide (TPR) repeat protein